MEGIYFKSIKISKNEHGFAAAVDSKGIIYTWGPNEEGQLGHGDFSHRILPTQVTQLKRKIISKVTLGGQFSIALGKDVSESALRRKKALKAKKLADAQNRQ